MSIYIVKNISREGPAIIAQVLNEVKKEYTTIDLSQNQQLPNSDSADAVIILGGPQSANDNSLLINSQLKFIQQILQKNIPYLGICLGMQLLVKAAGGEVKNGDKECGWLDSKNNPYTLKIIKDDPLFQNIPNEFQIFQLHGQTVTLTKQMGLLATSKNCTNQIIRLNNAYGIQGHLELTEKMLQQWIAQDPDLNSLPKHRREPKMTDNYTKTGKQIIKNFLSLI